MQQRGTIQALWRYPVKSMQGEPIAQALVTERGIVGDRAYAIVDQETGYLASAKYPRKWRQLLACTATFETPPSAGAALPPVWITLPDGTRTCSSHANVHRVLSQAFGRAVQLVSTAAEEYLRETDRTPLDAATPPVIRDEPIALAAPRGTFFDVAPLHILSTATLARLHAYHPDGQWDARRFRPNIVVALHESAETWSEQAWLDTTMLLGNALQVHVIDPSPRCVVTTLQQGDLPGDTAILRTLAQHTQSTSMTLAPGAVFTAVAGIYAQIQQAGNIACGDAVKRM